MEKYKKKKAAEKDEPKDVAKCNTLNEIPPNHDELITSVAQNDLENISIKSMIQIIREQHGVSERDA